MSNVMKKVLILEDDDSRIELFKKNFHNADLHIVKTSKECIEKLQEGGWWGLFLDHDLGGKVYVKSDGEDDNGCRVAKYLSENEKYKPENIFTHSLNEDGRKNICSYVEAKEVIFVWMYEFDFNQVTE